MGKYYNQNPENFKFKCEVCGKRIRSEYSLGIHKLAKHKGIETSTNEYKDIEIKPEISTKDYKGVQTSTNKSHTKTMPEAEDLNIVGEFKEEPRVKQQTAEEDEMVYVCAACEFECDEKFDVCPECGANVSFEEEDNDDLFE